LWIQFNVTHGNFPALNIFCKRAWISGDGDRAGLDIEASF
jgi:hypothetical protein